MERRTRQAVQQVGSMLIERGDQDAALRGMGSTLTAARSCGRDLLIVHVGDSRAYLFRAGRLERLTRDHTYAQMLVDAGQLPPGDVTLSGFRHVLINALGGSLPGRSRSTLISCASKTAIGCSSAVTGSPTASTTIRSRRRSAAGCPRVRCAIDFCSVRSILEDTTTSP
jgi:serine/threonine protein phosphatase PrpC